MSEKVKVLYETIENEDEKSRIVTIEIFCNAITKESYNSMSESEKRNIIDEYIDEISKEHAACYKENGLTKEEFEFRNNLLKFYLNDEISGFIDGEIERKIQFFF